MTEASKDCCIDYVEFPTTDIAKTKRFYQQVFGWEFRDHGPGYTGFRDGRLRGGFTTDATVGAGGPLVVIYAKDLSGIEAKVKSAGGRIVKEPLSFPGGRRFYFADPAGNVLAVWSDRE